MALRGVYYVVVFGAYVALALWLPKYYVDVYGVDLRTAGLLTALFIFPASLVCLHFVVVKMLRDERRHTSTISSKGAI